MSRKPQHHDEGSSVPVGQSEIPPRPFKAVGLIGHVSRGKTELSGIIATLAAHHEAPKVTQVTDRDRWAEAEARQLDKTAEELRKSAEQWRAMEPSAETMNMAQICYLKSDVWAQAAQSLRQPYQIRLEREAMMEDRGAAAIVKARPKSHVKV